MARSLFEPVTLGALTLKNRIVMAPLTRSRYPDQGIPSTLNARYYAQRESAGAIISEGTYISDQGRGYPFIPGIKTPQQVTGWQEVTSALAAASRGSTPMFMQLWHVGGVSHPQHQPDGQTPIAPSAVKPKGEAWIFDKQRGEVGHAPFLTPQPMTTAQIRQVMGEYVRAAENAVAAGFAGVEFHCANGYLPDQFLNANTNKRTDSYGGSTANRARFLLHTLEAICTAIGSDRVGIRLSPYGTFNHHPDDQVDAVYPYLLRELDAFNLAYCHIIRATVEGPYGDRELPDPRFHPLLRRLRDNYRGTLMLAGSLDRPGAEALLAEGVLDLAAFGRPFIANPDLVYRLQHNIPLAAADESTYYGGGAEGYTDYGFYTDP